MPLIIDIIGKTFGRLKVLSFSHRHATHRYYECACECGLTKMIRSSDLRYGKSKSCGCLSKDASRLRNTTHGLSGTRAHISWHAMIDRCINIENVRFKDYGGRGIRVCESWLESFENFHKDMGDRPEGMSLDRINNNGNYEASNCKWSTPKEQAKNRRPAKRLKKSDNG